MRAPLPFLDLLDYRPGRDLRADLQAAAAVTVLSIPQALAYAVIAGLPPVMGLYAAAIPTVVGSLLRSSRHVVTGPSNALSLLVGGIIAAQADDPVSTAVTLAAMVGIIQASAGLLRLGTLADFISRPVVLGYVTGAGLLLVVGQLPNLTGTRAVTGMPVQRVALFIAELGTTDLTTLALGLGTFATLLAIRRFKPRWPGALLVTLVGLALSHMLRLPERGTMVIGDLGVIPRALPSLTLPRLDNAAALLPAAVACSVLSLVESASVARAIASRSRQRLDMSVEFAGQGAANLAGAFFGAYPTSGSLARSTLNASAGARSRLSGTVAGLAMLVFPPLAGPVLEALPVAVLAGLICLVAVDLVDGRAIRAVWGGSLGDRVTFAGTLLGTWTLPLDTAIEVGIGLSLVGFLRQARVLVVHNLSVNEWGRLRERPYNAAMDCRAVRLLQLEGSLFFAAAGELRQAIDEATSTPDLKVLVIRLKRTRQLDVTTADALAEAAEQLALVGRTLILTGIPKDAMDTLRDTGATARIGGENLFETSAEWFSAMRLAVGRARELTRGHTCHGPCPLERFAARSLHPPQPG